MSKIQLTERQKMILALVVREHVQTAQPVGSKRLSEDYGLEVSSATIRNEMAALAEAGYLRQPYTSAGRVPTEEGYRFFVGQLMAQTELPAPTKRTITHQFYQTGKDMGRWMRLAASVLAKQSLGASLVTAPQPVHVKFKHLELIQIRGNRILMVLVLAGGEVRQQMLELSEPVTQRQLREIASRISELCEGSDGDSLRLAEVQLDALGKDVLKLARELMDQETSLLGGEVYRDGLTNVLAEPEFSEPETARQALRVLEERPFLEDLLNQTVMNTDVGVVQVLIGGEENWEELSDCSVVLARYGAPELAIGTLGVLGPIRMRYGRTISTVRFVAGLLSELVIETHLE